MFGFYFLNSTNDVQISDMENSVHFPDITEPVTINVDIICWIIASVAVLLGLYIMVSTFVKLFIDMNTSVNISRDKEKACVIPEPIGWTHAGLFTADDVFAVALLKFIHPEITIKRKDTEPPNGDIFVFNTGNGRYGQNAFKLLWRDYASKLELSKFVINYVTEHLVKPLYEQDSIIAPLVTLYAHDFSDDHSETEEMQKNNYEWEFYDALSFATEILERMLCYAELLEEKEAAK